MSISGPFSIYAVLLLAITTALTGCQAPLAPRETGTEELHLETERIPIDNCGGPAAVTVRRQISKSFYHDVYVDVDSGVQIDAILVSTALGQTYGYEEGEMETRSFGIDMTAPAHTRVVYVLEWKEVWVKGVIHDPDTGTAKGTYRLRKDLRMEILDNFVEVCP